jgi:hypothetical protein
MIHIFKRSKVIVDAFTYHAGICEQFPISKASDYYPIWWKSLPKSIPSSMKNGVPIEVATMKTCEGFIRNYSNSLIVPLWSDLAISTRHDGSWAHTYSANEDMPSIVRHDSTTHGGALNGLIALKVGMPWLLQEKSGVRFHLTSPVWNNISKINTFTTLPGTVDFKYQNTINNMMVFDEVDDDVRFSAGTPFLHIIPLTEKDVEVKIHKVSKPEYDDLYLAKMYRSSFINTYSKHKARCPFNRGKDE